MLKQIRRKIYNSSKIIGDRFGFDLPYYVENGFWLSLSKIIELAFGVAISVFFARFTTLEIYGQYNLLISILAILSILSAPGLSVSALRAVAKGNHGVYKKAVNLRFIWSLTGIPLLLLIGLLYFYFDSKAMSYSILASALLFPLFYSVSSWPIIFQGKEKFNKFSKFEVIRVILSSSLIIGVIYLGVESIFPVFITYLIVNSALNFIFYFLSLKEIENDKIDNVWKSSGYKLTFLKFISLAYDYIDKLIIGFFLGPEKLAVYAIAVGISSYLRQINGIATRVIMPKLFKISKNYFKDIFKKLLAIFSLSSVLVSILMFFILPFLITFLYSNKYFESIFYAQLYLITIPFYSISTIYQLGMIYLEEETDLSKIKIFSIIINLILYFILIPYFELVGAIVASVIYFLILDIIFVFKFKKIYKYKLSNK
ncbi:MAG: oligosaccharide flippase family protein [Bacteroidales bacterium]|nr:oligosaccharide flippase family protein [Bacteroidales bacterium]MBN2756491.1 oligosaccharide flippase family protein [Bacteroidales bacterium]